MLTPWTFLGMSLLYRYPRLRPNPHNTFLKQYNCLKKICEPQKIFREKKKQLSYSPIEDDDLFSVESMKVDSSLSLAVEQIVGGNEIGEKFIVSRS